MIPVCDIYIHAFLPVAVPDGDMKRSGTAMKGDDHHEQSYPHPQLLL